MWQRRIEGTRGRRLLRPALTAAFAAAIVTSSAAVAATNAFADNTVSGSPGLVRTDNVLPGLAKATLLGPAPAAEVLTVDIGLTNPYSTLETAEYNSLYNPESPAYHDFLTPAQFDAQFAEPTATVAATKSWLTAAGFTPSYIAGAGNMVAIRGSVSQLSSLFKISFNSYQAGPFKFIANTEAPAVPAALPIDDVTGLNTLQRMWTEADIAKANGTPLAATPAATKEVPITGYNGTLMAQDLWGVYDATPCVLNGSYDPNASNVDSVCPPDTASTPQTQGPNPNQPDISSSPLDLGQGATAGMFGSGYSNGVVSDLRVWEQQMGLPQVAVRVVQEADVTSPSVPNDEDVYEDDEWNLDNQAITGIAPRLSQDDLYFASTPLDPDFAIMFADWANDPSGPTQMNASFGECSSDPTSPYLGALADLDGGVPVGNQAQLIDDQFLEQAVLEGRTLFASAGDSGGSCPAVILPIVGALNGVIPNPTVIDQNYPCESAWAVCVGGTVVSTNGTTNPGAAGEDIADDGTPVPSNPYSDAPYRVAETTWNDSGGGSADNVPEPAFQKGVTAIDKPCTMPETANGGIITPGTTCRGVPDVSAMSGDGIIDGTAFGNNGYLTDIDLEQLGSGGTSLSSPLTVGMWSRIQAASPEVGGTYPGLGFADPTFYRVGESAAEYAKDFYNVSSCELPTCDWDNPQLPNGDSPEPSVAPDGTGWNYNSGWGAIDVDGFIGDPAVDNDPSLLPTHADFVPGAAETSVPAIQPTCAASWTSPLGNAYDTDEAIYYPFPEDSSLNITASSATVKGGNLIVTMAGPSLSLTPPPNADNGINYWAMLTDQLGQTFFVTAQVNPTEEANLTPVAVPTSTLEGTVTYGDGVVASGPSETIVNSDAGTFGEVNGLETFSITVPLAHLVADGLPGAVVGGKASTTVPSAADTLSYPYVWNQNPNLPALVTFAVDESVPADPSYQFTLADCS
jgi:subtilase family serine protease